MEHGGDLSGGVRRAHGGEPAGVARPLDRRSTRFPWPIPALLDAARLDAAAVARRCGSAGGHRARRLRRAGRRGDRPCARHPGPDPVAAPAGGTGAGRDPRADLQRARRVVAGGRAGRLTRLRAHPTFRLTPATSSCVNPNNPDGRVLDRAALDALADACAARGGWLIVDESFADLDPAVSVVDGDAGSAHCGPALVRQVFRARRRPARVRGRPAGHCGSDRRCARAVGGLRACCGGRPSGAGRCRLGRGDARALARARRKRSTRSSPELVSPSSAERPSTGSCATPMRPASTTVSRRPASGYAGSMGPAIACASACRRPGRTASRLAAAVSDAKHR